MAIDVAKIEAPAPRALRKSAAKRPKGAGALARMKDVQIFQSRRASLDDLVMFSRQLALLIETGNGIVPSISALASQTESHAMKQTLEKVYGRLEEGSALSECMKSHPKIFDSLFTSLVKAGEASGALKESLIRISEILDVRRRLRGRVREAMAYPIVLSAVMSATLVFLLTYVVPKFSDIFASLGDELPISTRMILAASTFLQERWYVVLAAAAVFALVGRRLWRSGPVRYGWDRMKIGMPVAGKVFTDAYLFQLFSTLGLLLGSRVPHLEAIGIAKEVVRNIQYERFFDELSRSVEAGRGVAQPFRDAAFLPGTVKLMISTGEASGALDTVMTRLSAHYRESLEGGIRRLSMFLEQGMLIVMGGVVGFVVISFILPIMKMSRTVH